MKWLMVLAVAVSITSAACEQKPTSDLEPLGRPDSTILSPEARSEELGVYVTDANLATTRDAPPGSALWDLVKPMLDDAVRAPQPDYGLDVERLPDGHELVADSLSPDGRLIALASKPRGDTLPEGGQRAGREAATTLTTLDTSTGREVGRFTTRTWDGRIDVEWSPTSVWVFMNQDEEHVLAFRPEQPARSLRQINVPHADDFKVVGPLLDELVD